MAGWPDGGWLVAARSCALAALLLCATTGIVIAQSLAVPGSANPSSKAGEIAKRRQSPGALTGHGGPVKALRADPASGRVLTGSFDYAMMLWDVSGDQPRQLLRLEDHGGAVNAVAFVPERNQALAAGDDGKVTLWDLATGKSLRRFEGHTAKIVGLAVSADGRWAASASWDRTARLWDLQALEPGPVLDHHMGPVNSVAFIDGGRRIATGSADGSIGLYETGTGRFMHPMYRHGWGINVLENVPGDDNLVLFGALNGSAGIVDANTGEVVKELTTASRPILAAASIDRPGLLAVGDGGGAIKVYRAADGLMLEEYQQPYGPVWALTFLQGGGRMYYGGLDDFATLWQVSPRAAFEPAEGAFPRRFQVRGGQGDGLLAEGELQFARKCSVCHTLGPDGANRAGPTLHDILGRRIGSLVGYPYSDALKRLDIVWSAETIDKLLALGPDEFTPGSKMPLQKMPDVRQRQALIAYLQQSSHAAKPVDAEAAQGQNSTPKGDAQ